MNRKRDPKHQKSVATLVALPTKDCLSQVKVNDRTDPSYVESEVLATLVRTRFGSDSGVLNAAVESLNKRVGSNFVARLRSTADWQKKFADDIDLADEAVMYFWEKFYADESPVSNAEVRFGVYQANRLTDFMRIVYRQSADTISIEQLAPINDDEHSYSAVDLIEDSNQQSPEAALATKQTHVEIEKFLHTLPKPEQLAYYYKHKTGLKWPRIAELLGVSVVTARKYYESGLQKLLGAMT